jgi:hypothetical protein
VLSTRRLALDKRIVLEFNIGKRGPKNLVGKEAAKAATKSRIGGIA